MRRGQDIAAQFKGLFIVHHNKPGQKAERHEHGEHHLIIPLRGEFRIWVEGREIAIGPGKMVFVPSQLEHEFLSTNDKEGERLICMLDTSMWKGRESIPEHALVLPVQQLCKELLFELLLHPKRASVPALVKAFAEVLAEATIEGRKLESGEGIERILARARDPRIVRAAKEMESSFREQLTVEGLARASGLSGRNFQRLFSKEMGLGPKEALIRLRLEEARRLLRDEGKSVSEACFECGYQSLSRFIQAYRDAFGRLPSER